MKLSDKFRFYAFLCHFGLLRKSYILKIKAVAFLGIHLPLLALLLSFVLLSPIAWEIAVQILVVALLATLIGTVITLYALHHLLTPVKLTSAALQNYLSTKTLPELPTEFPDEVGTLMTSTSETLHQLDELIYYISNYDHLTGLANRDLFCERLQQKLSQLQDSNRLVAVLIVGIDDFTRISHAWTLGTANLLLKAIAQRLIVCVPQTDILAHLSDDEFAIALTEIPTLESVIQLSQLLLSTLAKPFLLENKSIHITASLGITLNNLDEQMGVNQLLQQAHTALYNAKQQGRNQYQFYSPEITAQLRERLTLENELQGALERNEMLVYYQPLVDLSNGKVTAIEALVRWQHPDLGLVTPAQFIPIAEANGLIVPLGEWVLRTACAQNRAWQLAGLPPMRVSVNLSARQFEQPNLVEMVQQVLSETGLEGTYLELEVTENALMSDIQRSVNSLAQLRAMGVVLALDDFGTGYSSLNYLKRFPVNMLKIDRSFIQDLISNPDSAAVTDAIIALAESLRLKITAEGVETEEQLSYLIKRGCHEGQGFYFSRPVPGEAMAQMLESGF